MTLLNTGLDTVKQDVTKLRSGQETLTNTLDTLHTEIVTSFADSKDKMATMQGG